MLVRPSRSLLSTNPSPMAQNTRLSEVESPDASHSSISRTSSEPRLPDGPMVYAFKLPVNQRMIL